MIVLAAVGGLGWSSIGYAIGLSVVVGAVIALVLDKRRRDLVELWKGLYEAKDVENRELQRRVDTLEARLNLFQSDFITNLAQGVTEAIIRIMDERYPK